MEKLFEQYKDYFRVGAAVSGIFLLSEEEKKAFFEEMRIKMEEFRKNFKPEPGAPQFKFPDPPKFPEGPLPDLDIVKNHFNLIVAENDTKMANVYRGEDDFNFKMADRYVKFAKENKKDLRWHTLVWHNQSPEWIFKNADGSTVSKEVLENRLKKYIFEVGKRYSDDVCSVDVVNECISDKTFKLRDGKDMSKWYDIIGPEYIDKAFFWAKEAFPKSSLVINDYNLEMLPGKRDGMFELLKGLKQRGVPVDTVGLQMHINNFAPTVSEIEKTIELYASLGLNVIVTEMEISVYEDKDFQNPDPKIEYTQEVFEKQAERYYQIFECFKKEAKAGALKDVILWGITDRFSWKNNFPSPGRTDVPLLFDENGQPKKAFERLMSNK